MKEMLATTARILLLLWFVTVSLFIFIPSYQLLSGARDADTEARKDLDAIPRPAAIPNEVKQPDLKAASGAYAQQVQTYGNRVAAYEKEVSAYVKYVNERAKAVDRTATYTAVVKDVLVTMVAGFVTTLLGLVFVNVGAQVVNNHLAAKKGVAPAQISLL